MATQAQIIANRINAQKSTGPRTAHGKYIVSQNAVKHSLLTNCSVIASESQQDFVCYRQRLLDELEPASPMESVLAERIVELSWRLKRASRLQNQAIDALDADQACDPFKKLTRSFLKNFRDKSTVDLPDPGPENTLGRLAVKDFSNARVLERLLIYERRIEHSLYKTILEFQRLNLIRKMGELKVSGTFFGSVRPATDWLNIFERTGIELRPEIDAYFARYNRQN